jgi:purine-binding chemotaxis protein CheW
MSTPHQFCTFYVDDLFFGIEVLKIQEVIRYQEMTRVPLASRVVRGLINLRGQIATAIDLRRRLSLPDRPPECVPINVVVRVNGGAVSLLVDEIGDVQEVQETAFECPPETLRGEARSLIRGTYKLDGRLLLVLDAEEAAKVHPAS